MKRKILVHGRGLLAAVVAGVGVLSVGLWYPLHSQGVGNAIAPAVNPLNVIGVPDANGIGLLEGNVAQGWPKITNAGQRTALIALGKELFWDMQVGGDGIQACASCHYHAGADHRSTGQMSPGFKGGDFVQDLVTNNTPLTTAHFGLATNRGIPVSEAAKIANGSTPDAVDGAPGTQGAKPNPLVDVNDVVSSQGPRNGVYGGLSGGRVDQATLSAADPGFELDFPANAGIPDTVRRVEPRNSPTVLNAVYNLRNFWDGRADPFFNGRNPLGFRDPNARVPSWNSASFDYEQLMIPLSSLASQAVGPIGSDFEMVFGPRPVMDLGKKMVGATPLAGQLISCTDTVLGSLTDCTTPGTTNRGIPTTYGAQIAAIFDARFHNAPGQCLDANGAAAACDLTTYTLMEYNFPLFFGLAVQAYEATLTTEQTIVDLLMGGVATGNVTNGARVVNVTGLSLEACVAAVRINGGNAQGGIAANLCNNHYAKFIHPGARSGSESNQTANPIPANSPIGGCANPLTCAASPNQANGVATLNNVSRGLGRFLAGATGCGICHINAEFTGATVSVITGFGAGPGEPLPPGQIRKVVERRVAMERMIAFNGLPTVYDSGFYNIGVRPTPEDISLGDQIGGVDLSFAKLLQDLLPGGAASTASEEAVAAIIPQLRWPTATNNLAPVPFAQFLTVFCGPGLNNPNANNNPAPKCNPGLVEGERILRNGAFKAPGLRNVKFTGPYFHNGGKMNLRQVVEFYKESGQFENLNFNNLDAGIRIFNLGVADEAALVELMETGLTDWRVAFESGKFSHPELCIPNGHNATDGTTRLAGVPAVGAAGSGVALQTFQQQVAGIAAAHSLGDACTVPGISAGGFSTIDVPPAP